MNTWHNFEKEKPKKRGQYIIYYEDHEWNMTISKRFKIAYWYENNFFIYSESMTRHKILYWAEIPNIIELIEKEKYEKIS